MNQLERIATNKDVERDKLESFSASLHVSIPAIVTSVDLSRQVVSARPTILGKIRDFGGEERELQFPVITEVPIVFPRAGGLVITFPVKTGDECLLVFADSCIDFWWQNGGTQSAHDCRHHDLSDAIAIFGLTSQPRKLSNVSSSAIEIRTDSRSDYLSLQNGYLEINIAGNTKITSQSNVIDSPTTTINGVLNVTGGINVSGGNGAQVAGSIHATSDITAGSISLQNHTHAGSAKPD